MKAINLDTYSLSLLTAKEDILNPRSSTNWALFAYDGATNNLKLSDSGAGGLVELAEKFHINRVLYGLCRVGTQGSGPPRIVMITWVGEGLEECRTTECAHHLPAIRAFFKEAHVFISARRPEDVTEEKIRDIVSKINTPTERVRRSPLHVDKEETVGTNYRKTNAAMEMRRINRDSFWARAEKEEEERKEEERRRALEDRRRFEKERVLKERREEEERDRKMNEKLQMIEEQKRMQAKLQAEGRKQEKARWEQQQREHEEDMRARFRRSESIEKAAEAAVLVSQRSINPREFFRQLSTSSSSGTIPSPGSPRTVKPPFRRYQRSLTDTAFIFGRSDSSTPTSPRSSTVVSPFSRAPNSPFNRSLSPSSPSHRDPVFQPINSPQRPADSPVSPHSPLQRSAPTSILPNLPPSKSISPRFPQQDPPAQASNAPSQAAPLPSPLPFPSPQPSAPPASPSLLASLSQPQPAPFSPPGPLDSAPALEAPPVPLPQVPAHTSMQSEGLFIATRMLSDLEPETDLTVQAVLVDTRIVPVAEDEDKEEEENEEEAMELKAPIALNAQVESPDVTLSLLRDQSAYAMTSLSPKPEPTDVNVQACSTVEGATIARQPPAVSESEFEAVNVELRSVEEMVPVLNPVEKESLEETDLDPKEEEPAVELLMGFSKEDEQEREEMVQSDQVALASALPVEPVQVEQPEEEVPEEEEEELDVSCQSHQLHITAGEVIKAGNQPSAQQKGNQPTNGFSDNEQDTKQNGLSKEHSGSERSLSPSELDQNCPLGPSHDLELNPCVMRHDGLEKDLIKESSPDGTLCVRAIYDYQAEDESELSLEPGDIISDVETVDKAWWRGCSKDGRQGLFPANYVETI